MPNGADWIQTPLRDDSNASGFKKLYALVCDGVVHAIYFNEQPGNTSGLIYQVGGSYTLPTSKTIKKAIKKKKK
jgi:hypothetical protein